MTGMIEIIDICKLGIRNRWFTVFGSFYKNQKSTVEADQKPPREHRPSTCWERKIVVDDDMNIVRNFSGIFTWTIFECPSDLTWGRKREQGKWGHQLKKNYSGRLIVLLANFKFQNDFLLQLNKKQTKARCLTLLKHINIFFGTSTTTYFISSIRFKRLQIKSTFLSV